MKTMIIMEIDADANLSSMPADFRRMLVLSGVEWPETSLIGTKEVKGRKIILINSNLSKEIMTDTVNTDAFDERGNQIKFNLGWTVLACESEKVDQSVLLPYYEDIAVLDENGHIIGFEPVTDLTGKLQTWSGHAWQY